MELFEGGIPAGALWPFMKNCIDRVEQMCIRDRLKDLDEVAYVRFASVYRQFRDIQTFMDELSKLLGEKK